MMPLIESQLDAAERLLGYISPGNSKNRFTEDEIRFLRLCLRQARLSFTDRTAFLQKVTPGINTFLEAVGLGWWQSEKGRRIVFLPREEPAAKPEQNATIMRLKVRTGL